MEQLALLWELALQTPNLDYKTKLRPKQPRIFLFRLPGDTIVYYCKKMSNPSRPPRYSSRTTYCSTQSSAPSVSQASQTIRTALTNAQATTPRPQTQAAPKHTKKKDEGNNGFSRPVAWLCWLWALGTWLAHGVMGYVEKAPGHNFFKLSTSVGSIIFLIFSPVLSALVVLFALAAAAAAVAIIVGFAVFPI
jgi:hypothetical protein